MAWSSVCKPNFMSSVRNCTFQQKLTLKDTIKKLSEESGIPQETLKRWYYEEIKEYELKSVNNDTSTKDTENTNKNGIHTQTKKWTCKGCEKEAAPYIGGSGKPVGPKSKYYGLCAACRMKAIRADSNKENEGMEIICPCGCNHGFRIPWSTVKSRLRKFEEGLKNVKEN